MVIFMNQLEKEHMEISLLTKAIRRCYGYDFCHYARASLRRRILQGCQRLKVKHISELISKILYEPDVFAELLKDFSVVVTEMFRDPHFYAVLRKKVIPVLKTYPFIKVWHAGCATGEEVYSLAIVLKEEGLYDRTQIYATDFNDEALNSAKEGIFAMKNVKLFTENYQKAGGKQSLSDYYHGKYDSIIMEQSLKENITFANHNLSTDYSFSDMNLILCRNVMIYFDRKLQNRVLKLFADSLQHNAFLCLGNKETLVFSEIKNQFIGFDKKEKIYQRKVSNE